MKANEAPEKIYLSQERDEDGCYVDLMWHKHPYEDRENILYVRSDALIEKACDAYCKVCNKLSYSVPIPFCRRKCESYNNFIKNIKL